MIIVEQEHRAEIYQFKSYNWHVIEIIKLKLIRMSKHTKKKIY